MAFAPFDESADGGAAQRKKSALTYSGRLSMRLRGIRRWPTAYASSACSFLALADCGYGKNLCFGGFFGDRVRRWTLIASTTAHSPPIIMSAKPISLRFIIFSFQALF